MSTQTKNDVIEIRYDNEGGKVIVVPTDNNVMSLPVKQAIEACRAFRDQIDFKTQFDDLLERLTKWTNQNSDLVDHCFLTSRDTGLLFLVVQKSSAFDRELEERLTDLDVEVANDKLFELIQMSVLAIPNQDDEITHSFFSKCAFKISNGE